MKKPCCGWTVARIPVLYGPTIYGGVPSGDPMDFFCYVPTVPGFQPTVKAFRSIRTSLFYLDKSTQKSYSCLLVL